ncbi:MAG: DUF4249 family protein, partial [Bacteroidota bacterium]
MYNFRNIWFFLTIFMLISCEKKIDFKLKESDPIVSVDASIETNQFPVVILTKSLNYFSEIDTKVISESMIRNAEVMISSEGKNIQLIKNEVIFPGNLSFVYYTCDSLNIAKQIKGEQGKKYELEVKWNNQVYKATTHIPLLKKTVDSLWWEKAPFTEDTSTKIILMGRFNDPPEFGDYIRYFTKVNGEPFFPGSNSAFDDLLVNGTVYDIQIPRSVDRNSMSDRISEAYFRRGDTITVKLSNI